MWRKFWDHVFEYEEYWSAGYYFFAITIFFVALKFLPTMNLIGVCVLLALPHLYYIKTRP